MGLFPLTPNRIKLLPPNIQKAYFDNEHVVGRYGVAGDGTCFFHSVCAALNKHNYLFKTNVEQRQIGHDFRCTFTKELTASKWDQFIEQHNIVTRTTAKQARRHFCNNKKWANEIMIRYVSATLHLNLIFIDLPLLICIVNQYQLSFDQRQPIYFLKYGFHFEAMNLVFPNQLQVILDLTINRLLQQ